MKVRKRVREHPSGRKRILWECDLGKINGKRTTKYFGEKADADEWMRLAIAKKKNEGLAGFAITAEERGAFIAARDKLAAVGGTLEEAVAYYLKNHAGVKTKLPLGELLDRGVLAKELAGRRPRYITQFGVSCRSFINNRKEQLAHTVTKQEIAAWLSGNGWAPKTQRVYLGDLRSLFSWAIDKGYAVQNPAAEKFDIAPDAPSEIHALTTVQSHRLLQLSAQPPKVSEENRKQWQRPPLLWFVALGLFAGIRPAELGRLDRSKVNLKERHVVIEARTSKTRQRRIVDLSKNACAWLMLDPLRVGPVRPSNWRLLWERLREEAGWRASAWTHRTLVDGKPRGHLAKKDCPLWPHDALRHTFASMHYATHQNESLLKAQMGHSENQDTLMRHYRALVTREEAKAFWKLMPGNV